MQLGGRKGIRPVKTWGGYGGGVAVSKGKETEGVGK